MDLPFLLLIAVIAVVLATAFIASWIHRDRSRRAATGGDWFVSDGAWSDAGHSGSSDCGGSDGGGCGGGD
ncbi:hypothetical protein [Sphingomonas sp. Leaf25]|uniref:hypothetical protein n=1 Tax=Sphingomonas sp. Leaf25 TaxID=1735692 RepID=UPI0006FA6FD9|nr:hypothetical protein [Sphingomonas sp. Leaf25]KQN00366.1 hypothetical protein ASE78_04405 [Sphingomonas sp. Leaf25]